MCLRDELHNTQSEPAASAFAGEALIDLIEGLKKPSPFAGSDSDAVVRH